MLSHRASPCSTLAALALLAGCATGRPAAGPACPSCAVQLTFEPQGIEVTPADLELAGKDAEALFAIGQAAFAAGELGRAAAAFDRLVDLHPGSSRLAPALERGGEAHRRLEQWRPALERFLALERLASGLEAVEAAFRVAECRYRLGELAAAASVLAGLAARPDLPGGEHLRALTELGVVELEAGQLDLAEGHLRLAISAWRAGSEQERLDDYHASQAQHYLGEVDRARFLAVRLDPSSEGEPRLAQALETRAALLLSAQGHYLRAIRMGHAGWAVASGYRIGELYDALHAALVEAPLPPGLDAEQVEAYRAELRRRVRVLVVKAITVYEQTLAVAGRAGVRDNRFVAETQAALDRMKQALGEVPAEEPPGPEPVVPPSDGPPAR